MYCAICSHAKTIKDKFIIYYTANFYFECSVSLQSASLLLNPLLKTVLSINQLSQVSPPISGALQSTAAGLHQKPFCALKIPCELDGHSNQHSQLEALGCSLFLFPSPHPS